MDWAPSRLLPPAATPGATAMAAIDPGGPLSRGLWTVPAEVLLAFAGVLVGGAVLFLLWRWRGRR